MHQDDDTHAHGGDSGCNEYQQLSRRQFLGASASVSAAAVFFPEWLPKITFANHYSSSRDVMLSIFMRGGTDGLAMVIPHADPLYYSLRPTIATPAPDSISPLRSIALDNTFAFPPAMQGLMPAYIAQDLLVIHAVGQLANNSRSHFDAQRYMEVGKPVDPDLTTGWLGRHLASVPPIKENAALRGIGIGSGLAKTLVGGPQTLPIADPANYSIGGSSTTRAARSFLLETNYADALDPLKSSALDALNTIELLASLNFNGYVPANGVTYPNTSFGRALRSVAVLIKSDIGIEAASIDIGGWDTHATQDPNAGQMFTLMQSFSNALGAFWSDVIATDYPVTAVALSEFGRNAKENGSNGTDHGRASAMFAMGKQIAGGRVLTAGWPGLAPEQLEDRRDLRVTMDYRDVLAEIVSRRLENNNLGFVFPGWSPTMRGVVR
jgi:uncharacterized protein (DUF1501 family)